MEESLDIWPVPSEDALWDLLKRLLDEPDLPTQIGTLQISGWQPQLLYFPEEKIGHSIRPSVARAVSEFHGSVSRAFALVAYGAPNARLLKGEDRQLLDITILVTEGSNGFSALEEALDRLVKGLLGKMESRHLLMAVVILLLLYFGRDMTKQWMADNYNERAADLAAKERMEMSAQETGRLKIITEALKRTDIGEPMKVESDESKRALIRPSLQENRSRVLGVDITRQQAKVILSSERKERAGHRLDGLYRVIDINTEIEGGFTIKLENIETIEELSAQATYDELPEEDIHIIFDVAEKKTVFRGLINAFYIGDRISRAYIVRAYIPDSEKEQGK